MNRLQSLINMLMLLIMLFAPALTFAQGTGSGPGMGSGTGTPAGPGTGTNPGGATTPSEDIDLPVERPTLEFPIEEDDDDDDDDDDDPTDSPPPVIYGEELDSENDTIFYVLDISCSMGWDTQSYTTLDGNSARGPRIDRAKAELSR